MSERSNRFHYSGSRRDMGIGEWLESLAKLANESRPDEPPSLAAIEAFLRSPLAEYASPDEIVELVGLVTDERSRMLSEQLKLQQTGLLYRINADERARASMLDCKRKAAAADRWPSDPTPVPDTLGEMFGGKRW